MPYPAIAYGDAASKFAYSPPFHRNTTQYIDDASRIFTGPRTNLDLIATATASFGEILLIDVPYNTSEYNITFFAPIVKCEDANTSRSAQISDFLKQEMDIKLGTAVQSDNAYYGFVPTYNSSGGLEANAEPRQQTPSNATNELWMTFLRPIAQLDSKGVNLNERHFQTCALHNASYHLTVQRDHGFQNVSGTYETVEVIPFPADSPNTASNMPRHAYSAFMWVMSDILVGRFAWYKDTNQSDPSLPSQYGIIDSNIQRTSLLGSHDLDAYFSFDEENGLYSNNNTTLSDQRLQDKAMAKNRTLDVLIEELSFNVTVSLMHNQLLS